MSILGLVIIVYFIYQQFKFEPVKKFKFWTIPVVSIIMFFIQFRHIHPKDALIPIIICLITGIVAGYIQTRQLKIKYDSNDRLLAKSGFLYLVGWLIVVGAQIMLALFFAGKLDESLFEFIANEAKRDVLIFSTFSSRESPTGWLDWLIVGATGLSYFFFSCQKFPVIRAVVDTKKDRQSRRTLR